MMSSNAPSSPLIRVEDVAKMPPPGGSIPSNITFSPDGKFLAYLHSEPGKLTRNLYAYNLQDKSKKQLVRLLNDGDTEENLSLEEKLRRERQRSLATGITNYFWSPVRGSNRLLVPVQGNLYVQDTPFADLRLVWDKSSTGRPGGAIDPQWSPDGNWIAFVQDSEVYVVSADATNGNARQVTKGARGTGKTNGLADYIAQEEMDRYRGFWWSMDSSHIAFCEVDETHIPTFRIMHSGKDEVGESAQEDHRYPFSGAANPKTRIGVINLKDTPNGAPEPVWMDLGDNEDMYIPRVSWLVDGSLAIQRENRDQTKLELLRYDIKIGKSSVLLKEESQVWINLHYLFRCLELESDGSFKFIWGSERTGFQHLYLYKFDPRKPSADLLGAITAGEWMVETLLAVDCQGQDAIVYFYGTMESVAERHLYATKTSLTGQSVKPSTPLRLTQGQGIHSVSLEPNFTLFSDVLSRAQAPPSGSIHRLPSYSTLTSTSSAISCPEIATFFDEKDPRYNKLKTSLAPPEFITIKARDGLPLHCCLYKPDPAVHGQGPYPTLISVYGGPHAQRVQRSWAVTVDMRAQRFRELGYLVAKIDNRGSARQGLAFEGFIKDRPGVYEVQDQVDGVQYLVKQGLTDPKRVAIYGWSYGGYMSALSLLKAPDTFKKNPEGYQAGNVMTYVDALRDNQKLLLVHGLIDENVHFRHTARLINALIAARKPYDLLLFPDERHMPRKLEGRVYMEERIFHYIQSFL